MSRPISRAPAELFSSAFGALAIATLAFFVAGGIVLPVASRFAAGPLGADSVGVGISLGAFSIAALAMRPVVGWASDPYGRRPLLVGGSAVTVVALAFHLVAGTLPLFILARSLLGIGEAFFFVAALAAGSDLAPPARRGEALSFLSLSLYLGLAIGPLIGEAVLGGYGYAAVWLVAGAIAAGALLLSTMVPETAPGVVAPGAGPRPRSRLIHPAGILPGVLILTGAWGMAGLFAFLPLYAPEVGMNGAALPLAIYALLVIALRLVFAKLPDQVGAVRLSGAALAVAAIGLAVIGLVAGPIGLVLGTAIFAVGVAFIFPALLSLAVSRVDEAERGSVVGTASAFMDLSFGMAPAVLGVIAGSVGYGGTFIVSAGVAAGGCLLLVSRRTAIARTATATG
jgi:MFS family permease